MLEKVRGRLAETIKKLALAAVNGTASPGTTHQIQMVEADMHREIALMQVIATNRGVIAIDELSAMLAEFLDTTFGQKVLKTDETG
jgi:hypothetical protein